MTTETEDLSKADKTRAKIIKRIHALMQRTTANGATEQEALSAAAMAAKLMAEHDLTLTNIEETVENPIGAHDTDIGKLHDVRWCTGPIADLTGTISWRQGALFTFFGLKRDAEIASTMMVMIKNAMDAELAKWRATDRYRRALFTDSPNNLRSNFMKACALRIALRIDELAKEKKARMASAQRTTVGEGEDAIEVAGGTQGTALVVQKEKIVNEAFDKLDIKFGASPRIGKGFTNGSMAAKLDGYAAGGRVGLGGIGDDSRQRKIEG